MTTRNKDHGVQGRNASGATGGSWHEGLLGSNGGIALDQPLGEPCARCGEVTDGRTWDDLCAGCAEDESECPDCGRDTSGMNPAENGCPDCGGGENDCEECGSTGDASYRDDGRSLCDDCWDEYEEDGEGDEGPVTSATAWMTRQREDRNRNIHDIETIQFDIAPVLSELTAEQRQRLREEIEFGTWDNSDAEALFDQTGRYDLLPSSHQGPRYVQFDADEVAAWLDANPAWVQDGVTPHPTGGYVTVERSTTEPGSGLVMYLDAEGGLHRLDGPASAWDSRQGDGSPFHQDNWYLNGLRHRSDGLPAVVDSRGGREWWEDGAKYAEFHILDPSGGHPTPRFE